ncbi:hypothetical protein [Blautia wexlerae]|uniref:hypothetical protein n=1 Tax=Blautia wexlerae TaxID=418240 RepID=UPI00325BB136
MVGLKKRHIKKMLKTGAKADGASLADIRTDIEATIDEPDYRLICLFSLKGVIAMITDLDSS